MAGKVSQVSNHDHRLVQTNWFRSGRQFNSKVSQAIFCGHLNLSPVASLIGVIGFVRGLLSEGE
jgi:hypothetical protein